jgi:ribosomal protein S18 acetylase RimI-like enzyme
VDPLELCSQNADHIMTSNDATIVRPARESDAEAIARVHIDSTREAYAPLAKSWPEPNWEERPAHWARFLAASQTGAMREDLVAEVEGRVVGLISGGEARQASVGAEVEVYVIHVLPEYRGSGLGGRLWSKLCKGIRGCNLEAMYVATLAELRCCSFYERRGGIVVSRSPRGFHGALATDVIYTWPRGCPHEPFVSGQ